MDAWALFRRWRTDAAKRRAVRLYLTRLPPRLFKDYGHEGPYTPAQVQSTLGRARLSSAFDAYALAIFCTPQLPKRLPAPADVSFDRLRDEVAGIAFAGMDGFSLADVHAYSAHHGGDGGHGHGSHGGASAAHDHHGGSAGHDGGGHH